MLNLNSTNVGLRSRKILNHVEEKSFKHAIKRSVGIRHNVPSDWSKIYGKLQHLPVLRSGVTWDEFSDFTLLKAFGFVKQRKHFERLERKVKFCFSNIHFRFNVFQITGCAILSLHFLLRGTSEGERTCETPLNLSLNYSPRRKIYHFLL